MTVGTDALSRTDIWTESPFGHLLFGIALGLVFATLVDLTDRVAAVPIAS
ncbi:hypothetical protein [Natronococcus sp.]